jgi:hypothetical protein
MAPEVSCWLELKLCHANERDGSQKISVFTPRFVRAGGGKSRSRMRGGLKHTSQRGGGGEQQDS